jgi:hypothetical protein
MVIDVNGSAQTLASVASLDAASSNLSASVDHPRECVCLVLHSIPAHNELNGSAGCAYYLLILEKSSLAQVEAFARIGVGICVTSTDVLPGNLFWHHMPTEEITLI